MNNTKLAVICGRESDLSRLLDKVAFATFFTPREAAAATLNAFDALAVLGGTYTEPLVLPIDARLRLEAFIESGKPVFTEYCGSFGDTYTQPPRATPADRLVCCEAAGGLVPGDLLDDHDDLFSPPYSVPAGARPLLYNGGHVMKHDRADTPDAAPKCGAWALWYYSSNVLSASICLSNFLRARYAPAGRWLAVMRIIVCHLTGSDALPALKPYCRLRGAPLETEAAFDAGMRWLERANIFLDDGASGVSEGLSHNIKPDGKQLSADAVRADCAGEVAGACFFDWLLHKNAASLVRFKKLTGFCFDKMQVRSGPYTGMLRWTTTAWGVCYQDDMARAMLGALLYMNLTGDTARLGDVESALDFLVGTTGTDGLRVSRTDTLRLTPERVTELHTKPSNFACAHHNAYYHAVLLLAYKLDRRPEYLDTARRGLSSLMAVYPDTIREHSETQELCRLLLPLACLYEATGEAEHLAWLNEVAGRLERYRHASGGYAEYDTGYKAARSRTAGTESSLLADNGDEVADLLYSSNWLPLGFAYAYYVTRDEAFLAKWQGITRFMSAAQTVSEDAMLDGSWNRGIDMARMEAYGVPHDIGWGPCCVESGWTVAEILMGLGMGLALIKKLI